MFISDLSCVLNPSELNAHEVDREPGTASGCECVCVTLRRAGSSMQDEIRNRHHWMDGWVNGWMAEGRGHKQRLNDIINIIYRSSSLR